MAVTVGFAVAVVVAVLLGYGGAGGRLGFGVYSMNLLSPVAPGDWGLVPLRLADPTGGQSFEGYQYLGGGLLLLLRPARCQGCVGMAGWCWWRSPCSRCPARSSSVAIG